MIFLSGRGYLYCDDCAGQAYVKQLDRSVSVVYSHPVDLSLSGHTHNGQKWPVGLITRVSTRSAGDTGGSAPPISMYCRALAPGAPRCGWEPIRRSCISWCGSGRAAVPDIRSLFLNGVMMPQLHYSTARANISMIFEQPPSRKYPAWSPIFSNLRPTILEHSNSKPVHFMNVSITSAALGSL
jgi:hypothetical protein